MENQAINNHVIIVGINKGNDELFHYEMKEMENLCAALELEVVSTIVQNLDSPVSSTYLGKGKLEEVKIYAGFPAFFRFRICAGIPA